MSGSDLSSWSDSFVARLSVDVSPQARTLWPALVILALAFAVPAARRWGRTLVTIVHEAGHAAVGIA